MWSLLVRISRAGVATEPPQRLLAPAPPNFRGPPVLNPGRCEGASACVTVCPTGALTLVPAGTGSATWTLDLGRCQFCGLCAEACPQHAISQSQQYALATRDRAGLRVTHRVQIGGSANG